MADNQTRAEIIMDSLVNGVRVTTLEVCFPRFILPEFNTHRVFSRNSASSRARSIKRTFKEVMDAPFIPSPFTKNQKGMSGVPVDSALQSESVSYWIKARDCAVLSALDLLVGQAKRKDLIGNDAHLFETVIDEYKMSEDSPSIHKQHVNRLLEPFMYHTTIVSSTEWDNFFDLRLAPDAQPEINVLAQKMKEAMDQSTATERSYHLPYMEYQDIPEAFDVKRSVASCASVSYKSPSELNDTAVERIFNIMLSSKHMSPFERIKQ